MTLYSGRKPPIRTHHITRTLLLARLSACPRNYHGRSLPSRIANSFCVNRFLVPVQTMADSTPETPTPAVRYRGRPPKAPVVVTPQESDIEDDVDEDDEP